MADRVAGTGAGLSISSTAPERIATNPPRNPIALKDVGPTHPDRRGDSLSRAAWLHARNIRSEGGTCQKWAMSDRALRAIASPQLSPPFNPCREVKQHIFPS